MSVALSAEQSDLLGRVGVAWPTADEDRIAAMAGDWRALGLALDQVREDHLDTTRTVLAEGSGAGIAAFGDWGADLAALLLPLVERCARVEAWLNRVAGNFYAAKISILTALDDGARQLEELRRSAADVPLIGDGLEAGIEKVLEPVYKGIRITITSIVTGLSAAVVDFLVPALVTVTEWLKSALQWLRKLIRFELGADWPTKPTDYPNPAHRPHGPLATPKPKDKDPVNIRALRLENEAATTLARAGYDVEQIPPRQGLPTPDYRIDGKSFDCYSPTTSSARNIADRIELDKVNRQADRIIINIDDPDARASVADLRRQFQDYPVADLKEVKVIAPGGAIIDIYP